MRPNQSFGQLLGDLSNLHLAGRKQPIFLNSTPRSGSTWLMDAIASDSGVRPRNERLNIRKPEVRKRMGAREWKHLGRSDSLPNLERYLRNLLQGRIGSVFRTPRPFQKNYHFLTDRSGSLLPAAKYWIGDGYPAEQNPVRTQAESPA